jgi:hypothetical protein
VPVAWKRWGRSGLTAEGSQPLDDLLRVSPGFARPGVVVEAVQFLADLGLRLALPPQFDGLGVDFGVDVGA